MTAAAGFAVIVFARAPMPGEAKTRLIPALGAAGAAALAERMLVHAVAQAAASGASALELCVTPDGAGHAAFVTLARRHPGLRLTAHPPADGRYGGAVARPAR